MKTAATPNATALPHSPGLPQELFCAAPLDVKSLDAVAAVGYASHMAYGKAFPPATLGLRARAIARLLPWLTFALAKQLVRGDHIPPLPNDSEGLEGGIIRRISAVPRYLPFV